ncbi:TPA: hypothetical protein P7Z72_004997 [Klebsiella pneumoniae]|nr:hypothetical protein [Klebsiella variicola]HBR1078434.1 hypothetical protein [Klebsiella quasipneumoniae subsp. quasipneumoniae]HBW2887692.1 hypothetical protein [Klebsiella pneumoniae]HCI4621870.1 hypothetical protein [Klebsiella quasipneumoniae subsp. similipneumoniae]MBU9733743.1 hypothetical protein [Klebsiella variicola]HBX9678324.1 hypothetical protein [Klebsiella pneumoniae]
MKFNEIFAKNRAEELPDDLFGKYVLPLGYEDVNLKKMTKASIVIGGRGYGKTMFLKYHCHQTALSANKETICIEDISNLGIYWRPDTSFSQLLTEAWLGKFWSTAFKTYMSLSLIIEFVKLANNLLSDKSPLYLLKEKISNLTLPNAISKELDIDNNVKLIDVSDILNEKLFTLCNWINAPVTESPPFSLDTKLSLQSIISNLHSITESLIKPNFQIYIDEFENLTSDQQAIINTLMKHGAMPLLFSVAYKKNADISHKTLSNESIVEQHDFRYIDLEELYLNDFDTFAGEILALRFSDYIANNDHEKLRSIFTSEQQIPQRQTKEYQDSIKNLASKFLPEKSAKEIANEIFIDEALTKKLHSMIETGLSKTKTKLKTMDFIDDKFPEASLINGALLNRKSISPNEVLEQYLQYKEGNATKYKSWIPNNLVGVILYLYNKLPTRICPVYAGYKQFVYLSRGNIRHFLELCHQSVTKKHFRSALPSKTIPSMTIEAQLEATLRTSELEIEKIGNFGAHGMHLKRVAKRLGAIFNYCQSRRSQSESEVNHFTLDLTDINLLAYNVKEILNESLVWSVLIEQKGTKSKSTDNLELNDYVLHPVLAPYFGISHRKKRKIKFSKGEVETIFVGSDEDFSSLLKKYRTRWDIEDSSYDVSSSVTSYQLGLL